MFILCLEKIERMCMKDLSLVKVFSTALFYVKIKSWDETKLVYPYLEHDEKNLVDEMCVNVVMYV